MEKGQLVIITVKSGVVYIVKIDSIDREGIWGPYATQMSDKSYSKCRVKGLWPWRNIKSVKLTRKRIKL